MKRFTSTLLVNMDQSISANSEAIDIKPYGSTSFNKFLEMIYDYSDHFTPFDQLIIYPTFIHVSFGPRCRRQVIDKRK